MLSEPQDKLDDPPAVAKSISKGAKHQLDIRVISETKLLNIETSMYA